MLRALLTALALFVLSVAVCAAETDGRVRVRLTRLGAPDHVTMKADCDYYLEADPAARIPAGETITVTANGDVLTISVGGRHLDVGATCRFLREGEGRTGVRFLQPEMANRFCGDLCFAASGGVVNALLGMDIEDYLYGVVGSMMPPSGDPDALMAQAVASRTMAMKKVLTRSDAAYDVTDSVPECVFRGFGDAPEYAGVISAVDATRGYVLVQGDAPIDCHTTESNGGQKESSENAWGVANGIYTVSDDPYDLESTGAPVRSATINKDLTGLDERLRKALSDGMREQIEQRGVAPENVRVGSLVGVTACDAKYPAPDRVYNRLTFTIEVTVSDQNGVAREGTISVSVPTFGGIEDWYDLSINDEDNEIVDVAQTDRAFVISFRRSGSGVGMSRRGAQVMAAQYGMTAKEILAYYYPGTKLKRMDYASDAGTANDATYNPIATARLTAKTELRTNSEASVTLPAGAVVDVYAVSGDRAAVGSGGKYGYVPAEALGSYTPVNATVVVPEGNAEVEATAATEVYRLPEESAGTVGKLQKGERMPALAWTERWVLVKLSDGSTGYVPAGALRPIEAAKPAADVMAVEDEDDVIFVTETVYMTVRADGTRVFEACMDDAAVIGTLGAGDKVVLGAYNGEWACVRLPGRKAVGYVHLSDLMQ